MIAGYLINKFRGDVSLFDDGIAAIEKFTGWRCFGVVPWLKAAALLPSEDSVILERLAAGEKRALKVAVPMLVAHRQFRRSRSAEGRAAGGGRVRAAGRAAARGCRAGGHPRFEIDHRRSYRVPRERLGPRPRRASAARWPCRRHLRRLPDARPHRARPAWHRGRGHRDRGARPARHRDGDGAGKDSAQRRRAFRCFRTPLSGYEIHLGRTTGPDCLRPSAVINGVEDGATSADGKVFGTYLHGLFGADASAQKFLESLGIGAAASTTAPRSSARWTRSPRIWKSTSTATRSSPRRGNLEVSHGRLVRLRPICAERPDVAFRVGADEFAAAIVPVGRFLLYCRASRLGSCVELSASSTAT